MTDDVDVLVVGFGTAGAAAAIAAHDAGATVAVLEKTGAGGGNCLYSGGFLFDVDGPSAVDHLDALCFGKTDTSVLAAFRDGLHEVPAWIESLGGATTPLDPAAFGGLIPSWPHFPGAGHVRYHQFVPHPGERPGPGLWRTLEAAVRSRGIRVELNVAVTELIVEDGTVTGVIAGSDAAPRAIRARRGVVLASGGFEHDATLRDAYLPIPLTAVGHPGNTGDTLALAQQARAALWHMSVFFGWFAFVHPDFPAAFTLDVFAPSHIYVDGDGRRFADETGWEVHDKLRCVTTYQPHRANRPKMPGFIIFDETARLAGPLNGIVGTPNDYTWSADNGAEVEAGWIRRADSVEELARAVGLDAAILSATLTEYHAAVSAGHDELFGRRPDTLAPLVPPLYAIPMTPGVATASGGPQHDHLARVVRPDGSPIEGLYGAGGASSIWGHLTEHGGGLTDAIVFGRVAGRHAASR
jgi:succinate dehydrogenase/fumarate reductase flavoprotein subunit